MGEVNLGLVASNYQIDIYVAKPVLRLEYRHDISIVVLSKCYMSMIWLKINCDTIQLYRITFVTWVFANHI